MGKIKLLSLFSGIGAFEKALKNIGEPFEVIKYCEIDKFASKAYSLIHNLDENMNLKDIREVETQNLPNDIDFVTYGFPRQDISSAGKQKGFVHDGELTRSGLFFEALRIIEDAQPKMAICENVKALTSKKFKVEFKIVLDSLNDAGYKNYWAVLNAKDYGVPQNRERVFIISIRNDIDHGFKFPEKYELKLRLKDLLENDVDEKYYLNDEQVKRLTGNVFNSANRRVQEKDYCDTLLARDYKDPECVAEIKQVGQMYPNSGNPQAGRLYDSGGISPSLDTCQGGNRVPKILCGASRGRNPKNSSDRSIGSPTEQRIEIRKDECTNTLTTVLKDNFVVENNCVGTIYTNVSKNFQRGVCPISRTLKANEHDTCAVFVNPVRIRKLTPKECFRLMGFDDCDVDILVKNGISNTQLYKMAGNSIVVDVLEEIFVSLLNQYDNIFPIGDTA